MDKKILRAAKDAGLVDESTTVIEYDFQLITFWNIAQAEAFDGVLDGLCAILELQLSERQRNLIRQKVKKVGNLNG